VRAAASTSLGAALPHATVATDYEIVNDATLERCPTSVSLARAGVDIIAF